MATGAAFFFPSEFRFGRFYCYPRTISQTNEGVIPCQLEFMMLLLLLTGIYYPPCLWLALEAANGSLHPQAEAEVFEQESTMPPNLKFRRHAITELRGGARMAFFSLLGGTNHTNLYKNLIKI